MAWNARAGAILQEPDMFSEDYLPKNILGREGQITFLKSCLFPILKSEKPIHLWLHGNPGTGKTATARYLANELRMKSGIKCVHINCRIYDSVYSILDHILNELRVGFGNVKDRRMKLENIRQYINDRPLLIILDEIDFIPPKERSTLLYCLSFGKIGLLCISESKDAMLSINGRTGSRLQPHLVEFSPYSPAEIKEILRDRAFAALTKESWNTHTLEMISGLADGDARAAIQALRNSAEFAEFDGVDTIRIDHISKAIGSTRFMKKSHALKKLGDHNRILYSLIENSGTILSTDLWDSYREECKARCVEPVAKRTYSYYLNRMSQLKLIEARRARVRGHVYIFSLRGDGKRTRQP